MPLVERIFSDFLKHTLFQLADIFGLDPYHSAKVQNLATWKLVSTCKVHLEFALVHARSSLATIIFAYA